MLGWPACKDVQESADCKSRVDGLQSLVIWPTCNENVDAKSVKANKLVLKLLCPAYRTFPGMLKIPMLKLALATIYRSWQAQWFRHESFVVPTKQRACCQVDMANKKIKADAWSVKKLTNHLKRLRSRSDTQRDVELHELAESCHAWPHARLQVQRIRCIVLHGPPQKSNGVFTFV